MKRKMIHFNSENFYRFIVKFEEFSSNMKMNLNDFTLKCSTFKSTRAEEGTFKTNQDIFTRIINWTDFKLKDLDIYMKIIENEEKIEDEVVNEKCKLIFRPKIQKGALYLPIKGRDFKNDKEKSLLFENGITIINLWDNSGELRFEAVDNHFKMIDKYYDKWKGKVKFFTLTFSYREDKQKIWKFIEEKKWNRFPDIIEHLYLEEDSDSSLLYSESFKLPPYVIVVDSKGLIRYQSNSNPFIEDTLINGILEGMEIDSTDEKKDEDLENKTITNDNFYERFTKFEAEAIEAFQNLKLDEPYKMYLGINIEENFNINLTTKEIKNLKYFYTFNINCKKEEKEIFEALLKKHFTEEEKEQNKFKIKLIKSFETDEKRIIEFCGILKEEAQKRDIDITKYTLEAEIEKSITQTDSKDQIKISTLTYIKNKSMYNLEDNKNILKLNSLTNNLYGIHYETYQCNLDLLNKIKNGDRYINVTGKNFKNNEEAVLLYKDGVTVIDFWAEWCAPCVKSMDHNFKIIEKNFEKWRSNVKFYSITSYELEE